MSTTYREQKLAGLKATFEADRTKLYRQDGTPVFGPEEHRERIAGLLAIFDKGAKALYEESERMVVSWRRDIALLDRDPLYSLKGDDLTRADALAGFIREESQNLTTTEFVDRIRIADDAGDTVQRILYARYGRMAARRRLEVMQARPGNTGQADAAELRTLTDALDRLEADLIPGRQEERDTLQEKVNMTTRLQSAIKQTRSDLDGTNETARRNMEQSMRLLF